MIIKALSVWDPWAWLCRPHYGRPVKEFETRDWGTKYRGPLLVCAAKRPVNMGHLYLINQALNREDCILVKPDELLPGHAVALVDLVDDIRCMFSPDGQRINLLNLSSLELAFGDFSEGRHALKLANHQAITPFPVTGRQGLFNVEVPDDFLTNPRPRCGG